MDLPGLGAAGFADNQQAENITLINRGLWNLPWGPGSESHVKGDENSGRGVVSEVVSGKRSNGVAVNRIKHIV